jgi:hypothetical protein
MPEMIPYGIEQEGSDIRAHVAPLARRVIVCQTELLRQQCKLKKYPIGRATQEGVTGITGEGPLVPIYDIPDVRILNLTAKNWNFHWESFPLQTDSTNERGRAAVRTVRMILERGRFPLWVKTRESKNEEIQILGTDIIIYKRFKIQVKCDYQAGLREWHHKCTGNIFMQTAERNPLKKIGVQGTPSFLEA